MNCVAPITSESTNSAARTRPRGARAPTFLARPLRAVGALAAVLWFGSLVCAQAQRASVEAWTPREWQPKLIQWDRDANQNFIEDDLERLQGDDRVDVILDLNDCPASSDLERLGRFGKVVFVGRTLTVACLRSVLAGDLKRLAEDPRVAMVEMDHPVQAMLDVSTRAIRVRAGAPLYSPNTVDDVYGFTGTGVNVAILDTGVDDGVHESLPASKFVGGFNVFTSLEGNPDDDQGHGTHVAGIILGTGGPGGTFRGVAPGAGLVDIKVLDAFGNGTFGGAIAGLDHCVLRRNDWNIGVLNMSLGGCAPSNGSDALSQAVNRTVMANIVVVVAMGNTPNCGQPNNFSSVNPPASADDAIAVAAAEDHNQVNRALTTFATYSFTGPRTSDGDADTTDENKPDVTAPGTAIRSAQFDTANGYVPLSGTSQAAPHVAGLAALIREAAPAMLPLSVRKLIQSTAEDRGAAGWDSFWGYGLIDGFAACDQLATTAKTDLRFDQNLSSPDPQNWLSADLFPVAPAVVEGVGNTIQANIRNNGANTSVGAQVRFGAYFFSNGDLNYHIATVPVPPILPGGVVSVTCPWTPSVSGPPPGTVHACLKAEIVTPFDTDYSNNSAQHNIDIQQTSSPAVFHARVVNTTGKNLMVVVEPDLGANESWVLEAPALRFPLAADDCPVDLNLTLTPRPGVEGGETVNIGIVGFAEDAPNEPIRMGGFSLRGVVRTPNQSPAGRSDAYRYVPGRTLFIPAPGVLENDVDPDAGAALVPVLTVPAEHGHVNLLADGSFNYTPDPGYAGSDRFVYEVSDGWARSFPTIVALDPLSPPKLGWEVAADRRTLTISWDDPGQDFGLFSSPTIAPAAWEMLRVPVETVNGRSTVRIPIDPGVPQRFYSLGFGATRVLPVFEVDRAGITESEAAGLAAVFKLPREQVFLADGVALFVNPQTFQAAPQIPVNDPELLAQLRSDSELDGSELLVRAIDFAALERLQPLGEADAIGRTEGSLREVQLLPTSGAPFATHARFEAFDLKGKPLVKPSPLDTTVQYRFALAGLPVIGPGAQVAVTFAPGGEVSRLHYASRNLKTGARVRVFEPGEAVARIAAGDPRVRLDAQLVYYAPPLALGSVKRLIPHYDVGGVTMVDGHPVPLLHRLIPATDDPAYVPSVQLEAKAGNGRVSAGAQVSGGAPPYRFRWSSSSTLIEAPEDASEIAYTITAREGTQTVAETVSLRVVDANGVEVQASHFLGELAPGRLLPAPRSGVRPATLGATDYGLERAVSDLCAGQQADFRNRFNADGIARDFDFTGASCWERDFREGGRGLDDSYADDTDLVFYMGHGWPDGFTFESSQDDGSVVFGDVVQAWGDRELEWLALLSCQVLADSSSSGAWWQRWGPAFDGLHQMLGFHTLAYDQGGFGGEFAEWMLGKRILFFRLPPMPIRSSWFLARQSNQPSSTVAAVIGALGPGGIACYDDYFWGRGPVGPDLRGANLRGWWRVTN